jgi:hypothetical protein
MELIRSINTTTDTPFIYVSMDTAEGTGCVGHWIWECALFLPYIKDIQKKTTIPLKILLNEKRRYKTNILADFGFYEGDIVYSTKMANDGETLQEQYVVPVENEYMMYAPKFFYLWKTSVNTPEFFEALERFRQFYISTLQPITKSTSIMYVARSKLENYAANKREFINFDDFCMLLDKKGVNILNIDTLSSLTPQFQAILSAKTIIVEMGSAFTINAAFIASNSHIIVINDNFDYNRCSYPFFQIFKNLMSIRNNTIEIFSHTQFGESFTIDLTKFETYIDNI